ncbi:MAG: carbonic anhydrase family protein [Ferruginibacter sp.]
MKTHTKEFFDNLTAHQAYDVLKEGNMRFVQNLKLNRNLQQQLLETAQAQYPYTVALSCMDSRTSVELIFDQGIGEIFSIRIAGNIINDDILGSMEYACKVVGSKLIMVLGHTSCGAIKGACEQVQLGHLTPLLQKIKPAIASTKSYGINKHNILYAEKVAYANVIHSMEEILNKSSIIKELYEEGKIGIVGGMFSIENGQIHFIKEMFSTEVLQNVSVGENEYISQ